MAIAYVLLNTELGQGSQVSTELEGVDEVKEVFGIYGVYDLIIKLEAENMSEIKEIIMTKIRRIPNIRSSLTLIAVE
jgi:DNA-binding Lrp family transcriptional regulator